LYIYINLTEAGPVPVFTETSSSALDDLLTRVRNALIMPAHLAKQQQDLIYKDKNKRYLASESVTAIIADEEFTLSHIDRLQDVPNGYQALWEAISLMKERKDWDNLPRLLHGMNNAQVLKFNKAKYRARKSILARKLGQAGRQDVLLECIRRCAVTGMTLREPEFVAQVMFWFQMKALESDWDAEATSKALNWAELVSAMMDDTAHTGGTFEIGLKDPRTTPEVIGVLLELAAVRASKHLGGQDKDGKVADYAQRLLLCLSQSAESSAAGQTGAFRKPEDGGKSLSRWISTHAPILYGMKEAIVVLGPESAITSQLAATAAELESLIQTYGKEVAVMTQGAENVPNGVLIYEKLFPKAG
jgi:hypothetical protein